MIYIFILYQILHENLSKLQKIFILLDQAHHTKKKETFRSWICYLTYIFKGRLS